MKYFYSFFIILLGAISLSVYNMVLSTLSIPGILVTTGGVKLTNDFIFASVQRQVVSTLTSQALLISILIVIVIDRYDTAKLRQIVVDILFHKDKDLEKHDR